jgi:hypothetical protein
MVSITGIDIPKKAEGNGGRVNQLAHRSTAAPFSLSVPDGPRIDFRAKDTSVGGALQRRGV